MTPQFIGNVHIHAPKPVSERVRVFYCPKCTRRRRVKVRYYEWYGPSACCTALRRRWKHVVEPCGYRWRFEP